MKNPRPPSRSFGVERVGRGHAKQSQHHNREPGVFVVAVGEFYSFRPDWHQDDRAVPLIRQYQVALDAVLRSRPDLASCAVCCRHCEIRFLTHPRNAGRQDLGCPFGCREHHRRRQAAARSKKHYQTDHGRRSKKRLNGKRSAASSDGIPSGQAAASETETATEPACTDNLTASQALAPRELALTDQSAVQLAVERAPADDLRLTVDGFILKEASIVSSLLLPYVAMVATVIEGRRIDCRQLLEALCTSMRQRNFDRLPKREYVLRLLNQRPP